MILIESENIIDLANGIILQRLNNYIWYVIKCNRIIDNSKHRDDLINKYKSKPKKKYTIMFIDGQGNITACDYNKHHYYRMFNTIDYPDAKTGEVIEVEG